MTAEDLKVLRELVEGLRHSARKHKAASREEAVRADAYEDCAVMVDIAVDQLSRGKPRA